MDGTESWHLVLYLSRQLGECTGDGLFTTDMDRYALYDSWLPTTRVLGFGPLMLILVIKSLLMMEAGELIETGLISLTYDF